MMETQLRGFLSATVVVVYATATVCDRVQPVGKWHLNHRCGGRRPVAIAHAISSESSAAWGFDDDEHSDVTLASG